MNYRVIAAGFSAALLICSLSSCTGTSKETAPAAPAQPSAPAAGQPTAPAATTTADIAATARCHTSDLRIAFDTTASKEPKVSQSRIRIEMRNTATHACTLYGYPGVHLTNGNKLLDGVTTWDLPRAKHDGKQPVENTVQPGDSAYAVIYYWPPAEGSDLAGLFIPSTIEVTPPDETTSASLKWPYASLSYDGMSTHPGTYVFPLGVPA